MKFLLSAAAAVLVMIFCGVINNAAAAPHPQQQAASFVGELGIQLLDMSADAADDPRARQYITDALEPGTTITRRVKITNSSQTGMNVSLYPAAATITGGSFVGGAGQAANELTTWTKTEHTALVIPAASSVTDAVTIAVPADAAAGEQYAVIWAETSGPGSGNINLVNRVGIRVYLAVSGSNPPPTNFAITSMTAERDEERNPKILATVHNTGGRALDLTGTLTLAGKTGSLTAGPYPVALGTTLAPGDTETVTVNPTDTLADGPWTATLTLQSGLVAQTIQADLTFPASTGTSPPSPTTATTNPWAWWVIPAFTAILAAIIAAATIIMRRRRKTPAN